MGDMERRRRELTQLGAAPELTATPFLEEHLDERNPLGARYEVLLNVHVSANKRKAFL